MSENKRITKIALENYRAFYGADNIIDLPNGENLLIYGENGSGKSSLFRAMEELFVSSKGVIDVREKINVFAGARPTWKVEVAFDEFDLTTNKIVPNTTPSILKMNHHLAFNDWWLKDANLAKGFLTYRDLLKTCLLYTSPSPRDATLSRMPSSA